MAGLAGIVGARILIGWKDSGDRLRAILAEVADPDADGGDRPSGDADPDATDGARGDRATAARCDRMAAERRPALPPAGDRERPGPGES